jgi:hypothetical protein
MDDGVLLWFSFIRVSEPGQKDERVFRVRRDAIDAYSSVQGNDEHTLLWIAGCERPVTVRVPFDRVSDRMPFAEDMTTEPEGEDDE